MENLIFQIREFKPRKKISSFNHIYSLDLNMIKKQFSSKAFKNPWVYPSLESIICTSEMENSDRELYYNYSFSVSPKKQFHSDPPRYHQFKTAFNADIVPLIFPMDYVMHLELSTKSCNYHFHGIARFNTVDHATEFYQNIPRLKELCTFKLQYLPTADDNKWHRYCFKQTYMLINTHEDVILKKKKNVIIHSDYRLTKSRPGKIKSG